MTSTRIPRRSASSAMIRAYGLSVSSPGGRAANSGVLIGFLRLTQTAATRANPSFPYSAMAASLSCITERSR